MGKRIVVETDCPHSYGPDIYNPTCVNHGICPGGSRRVLTEGEYVLIEKVDGEWPDEAVIAMARVVMDSRKPWSYIDLLDALARGDE